MSKRRERYQIVVTTEGLAEAQVVSVFSRRIDALKRAKVVTKTWQSAFKVELRDTNPDMFHGQFANVLFTWSRYTKAQLEAAIDAEAKAWAEFFAVDGDVSIRVEERKQHHRANLALNFIGTDLRQHLLQLAKLQPTHLYVGRRENILAEVGEHNDIYEGKFLACPVGEPQFDCDSAANITELRAIVEEYRSHYPTISVCYV